MLLRHSAYYLIARGVPGLVSFAALALYTRMLAPDEFGRYALVLAGVGLANVFVFQWIRLVVGRFLQAYRHEPQRFLSGVLAEFSILAVVVASIGLPLALLWPDPVWQRLLILAVPLLLTQAYLELTLAVTSAGLQPGRYGKLLGGKAVIALVAGGLLVWAGLGAAAPILGLIIGQVAALVLFGWVVWRGVRPRWPERTELRRHLAYGLPLTVTFALAWVVSGSDRLLLAWFLGEGVVGVYAAGYDLGFQSLTLLLTIINTAAYPLAVKAHESRGEECSTQQLAQNGGLIFAAAMAGGAVMIVLAPGIVGLFIGEAYRAGALSVLPIVVMASALAGIKAYHFDIAFHLGEKSRALVSIAALAAAVNLLLNVVLIPAHGIQGAAWATLGAYAIALGASSFYGWRVFRMPPVAPLLLKGCATGGATATGAWAFGMMGNGLYTSLVFGLGGGALAALLALYWLNLNGLRTLCKTMLMNAVSSAGRHVRRS